VKLQSTAINCNQIESTPIKSTCLLAFFCNNNIERRLLSTTTQLNSIQSIFETMLSPVESFRLWRDRNRSRQGAEPIDQQEEDTSSSTPPTTTTPDAVVEEEHNHDVEQPRSLNHTESGVSVETVDFHNNNNEQLPAEEAANPNQEEEEDIITISLANRPRLEEVGFRSDDSSSEEDGTGIMNAVTSVLEDAEGGIFRSTPPPQRGTVTLVELEEERELTRRRSSACVMLCLFVLVRMWVEALLDGNFGLFLLCSVLTSWALRWHRYNREREEELDRRIQEYWNARNNNNSGANGGGEGPAEMPRSDLAMLSFQAQLALAIMESQRQVMQGGYGHPDGEHSTTVGVSDDQKQTWKRTKFSSLETSKVAQEQEEDWTCSICLCDYEPGDNIVTLPCGHMYHEDCVSSWTSNHIRCPLCNYDLTAALEEQPQEENNSNAENPTSSSTTFEENGTTATEGDDSIV